MDFTIISEERKALLEDARETIAAGPENRRPEYLRDPELQRAVESGNSALLRPCGAGPVEQGWNPDEYPDYICVKAGLPPGSCENPEAKLFGEN